MSVKRGGLGRNLSVLLTSTQVDNTPNQTTVLLKATSLQAGRYQPRITFDDDSLLELSNSIRQQGLLQPLLVRAIADGRYEIIAGERRFRACVAADMTEIPVIVRQVDDETAMALALIENLQREDLNAMDQARAIQRLSLEFGLTHEKIAALLCTSRAAVSNHVRLLKLTPEVQNLLEAGQLDMGHARSLLILNPEQQIQAAQLVVERGYSVRDTEALVTRMQVDPTPRTLASRRDLPLDLEQQAQILSMCLQRPVQLKPGRAGSGTVVIRYDKNCSLENLIEHLQAACCT